VRTSQGGGLTELDWVTSLAGDVTAREQARIQALIPPRRKTVSPKPLEMPWLRLTASLRNCS
jgi:hypothetical protein